LQDLTPTYDSLTFSSGLQLPLDRKGSLRQQENHHVPGYSMNSLSLQHTSCTSSLRQARKVLVRLTIPHSLALFREMSGI
jgi:hypothetical protein